MTNDRGITRYEINAHGELPLSYGMYVRWEDLIEEMQVEIYRLQEMNDGHSYSDGYDDGYDDGRAAAREELG